MAPEPARNFSDRVAVRCGEAGRGSVFKLRLSRAWPSLRWPRPRPAPVPVAPPSPGRAPARTSSTRRRRARRSSRTPACGRRSRSWSPARAPTATASSSTRTSSTTTTARAASATRATRARTVDEVARHAQRHLHVPDRSACTRGNAADFVELRVKPLRDATAFRRDAQHAQGPVAGRVHDRDRRHARRAACRCPHGAGASAPGRPVPDRARRHAPSWSTPPRAQRRRARRSVKRRPRRRQFDVRVAARRLGPGTRDGAPGGRRRAVGRRRRTATCAPARPPRRRARRRGRRSRLRPRSSTSRSATSEPFQGTGLLVLTNADAGGATGCRARRSRDGDLGQFAAQVDFAQARRGRRRRHAGQPAGVPQAGPIDRILASRFETGAGHRLLDELRRPAHAARLLHGRVPGPPAAVRDLRPAQAAAGRRATA